MLGSVLRSLRGLSCESAQDIQRLHHAGLPPPGQNDHVHSPRDSADPSAGMRLPDGRVLMRVAIRFGGSTAQITAVTTSIRPASLGAVRVKRATRDRLDRYQRRVS